MDRLPRKPFLVGGDAIAALIYLGMGFYLSKSEFSYTGYLICSLILSCVGAFDSLAYQAIFPNLIPEGQEQKGYAVSSTLYPLINILMMPLAALLMDWIGIPNILLGQGVLCLCAAGTESLIRIREENRLQEQAYTLDLWKEDIREALLYLRKEKGLQAIYSYMAISNGAAQAYNQILVAFFRTAPGFSAAMYSLFTVAEFLGRTVGGAVQYHMKIPKKWLYWVTMGVYQFYELMDMILLWIPYPLMLVNRGVCGFLGVQSATMRNAAVQSYIPDSLRARVNAFLEVLILGASSILSVILGALGEVLPYRLCMSLFALLCLGGIWLTVGRAHRHVRAIYERESEEEKDRAL